MKPLLTYTFVALLAVGSQAQLTKKDKDKQSIKQMCGCFEVEFNFAETFAYSQDEDYTPSKVKHEKAIEWVQLIEDSENKIVMQHLLQFGNPSDPKIVKHWRQDWLFENTDFYIFDHDNHWKYVKKSKADVSGQWTQKVFQVDDSPRYEGSASWVHIDGKSYWENQTDAPLPRREITKRSDYNVTIRGNRHEIIKSGWIHDQDNDKVIRKNGKEDMILAQEKGYNKYTRIEDRRCQVAQDWWKSNNQLWKVVRTNWENIFDQKNNLTLHHKVGDKRLYEQLFKLDSSPKKREIKKIIESYIIK